MEQRYPWRHIWDIRILSTGSLKGMRIQMLEVSISLRLFVATNIVGQVGPLGTALQAASENGHLEVVKLLLDHGANVDGQSEVLWLAGGAAEK